MKKIFTLIALAAMAITPKSAFAQEGITQTTYWNFDQFQAGNEDVAFDTPVNYGGLYIVGHSAATAEKPAVSASTVAKSLKDVKLGDQTYQINYGIKFPGAYTTKIALKASEITKDAIAFDAGCAGTLYVYAEGTDAKRGIVVYFNGEKKQEFTSAAKGEQFTASVNNDQAGTYYITTVRAAQIYAVKFVPTSETASTKKITLPEQGVMTFSDVHAWTVPAGLKAYIAGGQKENQEDRTITLALTQVETIPACTGVILEGKGGESYDLTSTDCGTAMKEDGTKSLVDLNYALRPVISEYTLEKTELDWTGDKTTDKKSFHNYILGVKDATLYLLQQKQAHLLPARHTTESAATRTSLPRQSRRTQLQQRSFSSASVVMVRLQASMVLRTRLRRVMASCSTWQARRFRSHTRVWLS